MDFIIGHEITIDRDECIVSIFLEEQMKDIVVNDINEYIKQFVIQGFAHMKISTVNVMYGTQIISTLSNYDLDDDIELFDGNMYYTVKEGDSLFQISKKFKLPILEIRLMNGLSSNSIDIGQRLRVSALKTYKVRSGDTLYTIGKKFGLSEANLQSINKLSGTEIYTGQWLIISNPISRYTVRRDDDLLTITQQYSILVEELVEYNGLCSDKIFTGQNLYIKVPLVVNDPGYFLVFVNKCFSLPSDFVPGNLVVPNIPFPFDYFHEKKLMRSDAAIALEELFDKAKEDKIELYGLSGYRSYSRQKTIFESSVKEEGFERANKFSAKPGNSEHQTGLAMDVTSPEINYSLDQSFENTKEGQWVKYNAHKFGFILRYLKGKEHITGYEYEPWHIRYVGKEIANEIYRLGITFEEYLGIR